MLNRHDDTAVELAELRARVRELEHELRLRDEFVIAAAHELRNPVSPLVLHVQRLQSVARKEGDGSVSAPWLYEQLELFGKRLTRFMSALNRILDVSRMRSGHIDLVLEPVDFAEIVQEVVAGFERELAASKSELRCELESGLIGCWDRMRLEQIVSNLLSNAIRYGNSRPIELSLARASGPVVLTVRDQGIGISEAEQARVFERFERGALADRSGFGVGLWVVRQLCEALGGSVSVVSREGEGSTFTVVLPTGQSGSGDEC